jgi:hypothetical protein
LGFVDLLRDDYVEKDRSRGIFFTQDWVSLPGVLPLTLCARNLESLKILHLGLFSLSSLATIPFDPYIKA